jgi:uncharacterized protein (DUF2062 family)
MPRRLAKRLSRQRHSLSGRWFMRPFRRLLANPAYWSIHRSSVTRAVAVGLFVAFVPFPAHMLIAPALAIALQVNLPVAIATTFVSNPLTMVPQYYLAYWTGSRLLGTQLGDFAFEMSWAWVQNSLLPIWKPFLLGCLVLGATSALIGYAALSTLWYVTLVMKYHERKRPRSAKKSASR